MQAIVDCPDGHRATVWHQNLFIPDIGVMDGSHRSLDHLLCNRQEAGVNRG
jgi:hypothetical protein